MANVNSVVSAGANLSTTALHSSVAFTQTLLPTRNNVQTLLPKVEDSVHLSDTAQKFLQASQTKATQTKNVVEQLVQAAAAGDVGALSLLTVI